MFPPAVRDDEENDASSVIHLKNAPSDDGRAMRSPAGIFRNRWRDKLRNMSAAVAIVLAAAPAWGQPAPTPEEVQQAQVRWNEGKAYFDAGNFEAARVAFKQAYTVFPHAAFLQNLGEAELRTGRPVEAARHFTSFLRAGSSGSPAQRELARKSLAKAAERLGAIVITTNVDDAEIRVDDEIVGRSPLGSLAWYVEPGRHLVTARKDGYLDGSERVDVGIGPPRSVFVRVQRVVAGTSEAALPEDAKPVGTHAAPETRPARSTKAPSSDVLAAPAEPRRGGVPARTVVLLSGVALTVAGAAIGTVYALRTGDDSTRISDAQSQFPTRSAKYPDIANRSGAFCAAPMPEDAAFCAGLHDDLTRQRNDRTVRDVAFVGAGVVGVATLATVFLWRPRPNTVSVSPVLSPVAPGVVVFGHF
jgi:hypothetical protein